MNEPCLPAPALPPPPAWYRWSVLLFISLAMFGNYYVYDCISPLADVLKAQLRFTDSNIGLLQAIYSIPNIFMVLIGGFIIDRVGTKKSTLLFGAICLLGAGVTTVMGALPVMAAGRLIFGLGAESLIVAVTTAIAKWFKGKELSFAFGVNLTIARLGSFAALNSPSWATSYFAHWQRPLLLSVAFGVISVVGGALYWGFEGRAERTYSLSKGEAEKVVFTDIFRFGASFWFITCLCVTFYSAMFPFQTFAVKFFMDKHLQAMPPDAARAAGGFLSSLLTLSAMILTPLFGLLVDKVGRRSLFMLLGSMLIIPVYLAMNYVVLAPAIPPEALQVFAASDTGGLSLVAAVSRWLGGLGAMIKILVLYYPNLLIPMAVMGMAFSLVPAVMWPSVAYVVDQPRLGTAYGLMTMIQNIGLAGFNMLIGWANDYSHAGAGAPGGYALGMWVFSSLGFLGLVFAFLLRRCERGPRGHGLETIRA